MTMLQFELLCNELSIHPAIALEDDGLLELLRAKKPLCVIEQYILTNF